MKNMFFLIELYSGHKKNFALMTLFFIIKSSCVWLAPVIVGQMVDVVTRGEPNGGYKLLGLATLQLILLVANYPTAILTMRYQSGVAREVGRSTRSRLVCDLHAGDDSLSEQLMGGELYTKATRDIEIIEQWPKIYLNNIVATVLAVGVTVYSMLDRAPIALLCFFILLPLSVVLQSYFQKRLQKLTSDYRQKFAAMGSNLEDLCRMRFLTKAHGAEMYASNSAAVKFDEVYNTGKKLDLMGERFAAANFIGFTSVQNVFFAMCLYIALANHLSLGEVLMFSSFFSSVSGSVMGLVGVIPSLAMIFESAKSLASHGEEPISETNPVQDLRWIKGKIELKNVNFRYGKNHLSALKNISLSVEPGEILGIVGPSGSGKSTLVSLMFGFLTPSEGTVYIDGHDSRVIDSKSFRNALGVVPQDIFLFGGSILENVTYGYPSATEDGVKEALKLAQAWDFVKTLKDDIHTIVGEGGMRLSGGQKQRLALARALIRNPRILFLDEATSAVDMETEKRLAETIRTLSPGRTIVIVSHRLESVKYCDKVVVLPEGRISLQGADSTALSHNIPWVQSVEDNTSLDEALGC